MECVQEVGDADPDVHEYADSVVQCEPAEVVLEQPKDDCSAYFLMSGYRW